ncbi:MAG: class I SAM-dependent methyltransferase [Candidatus Doudnabacteria bacterium]|nr:class I SAM-dependent methyltransferase [Candidatus Doudnabacteria bacterium]
MNTDLQNWDDTAVGWDKKIAQPDTFRTLLITNAMEKLLSDCEGKDILDAGCGNGYFSNWLRQKGANVVGADGSDAMIVLAKQQFKDIKFQTIDFLKSVPYPDRGFNIVLANMLLMHMSDITIFLKEASRILKPDGTFIFSILHPCFNEPTAKLYKSLWHKLIFAKPFALAYDYYSKSRGRYENHLNARLSHYHRTLEEYSLLLKNSDFTISELGEPHELPEDFLNKNPKLEYANRLPRFLFFKCIKHDTSSSI